MREYDRQVITEGIVRFWADAREAVPSLPVEPPEAWAFGATSKHADELLALVLSGIKTGTASALWDHGADEPIPAVGDLSIILDGAGEPRAVIETVAVETVPFDQVTAEHARVEGEQDRTLESWRRIHEEYWRKNSTNGFARDMPVVCERFHLVHPVPGTGR